MLSNRESARRSRRRKQAHLGELQLKVNQLQSENQDLLNKLHQLHVSFNSMMARNRMIKDNMAYLRMQIMSGEPLSREALVAATQAVAAGAQTNLQDLNHLVVGGPGAAGMNTMLMSSGGQMGVPYVGGMGGMVQGGAGGMNGLVAPQGVGSMAGMGSMGSMGSMRAYNLQMSQAMNRGVNGVNTGMGGMFGGAMGGTAQNMAAQNGLGNFKLEAGGGVSEFSNASSLTQQGSMGAGDGPSIRGVKGPSRISDADPDAFIDGGGGPIAEREATLAAAVAAQLRMGTPIGSGEVLHQLADQEAALAAQLKTFAAGAAGDGAMPAGAMPAGARQGADGVVGGRKISGAEDFRLPDGAAAATAAAARAAAQGRNGRQASDGSCADARRKQRAGSGDSSDARAGGGSGSGSGNNSGDGGDSELAGKGQQQQSRGALSPLDHDASPLAAPIAEKPPHIVDQVGVDAADSTVLGFLSSPILEGEVVDGWRHGGVDFDDWASTVIDGGGGMGTETKEPGTLGKNARTASMNRVASLEHMAKRAQAAGGPVA